MKTPEPVVLIMAKAPVPAQVKTRLATTVGDDAAARLAADMLLDTIDVVVGAVGPGRCAVALGGDLSASPYAGELGDALAPLHTFAQAGGALAERIIHAHRTVAAFTSGPTVQIGMDTPHLDHESLSHLWSQLGDADAALGMATDGGWWGMALRTPTDAAHLGAVPMSTDRTGFETERALRTAGRTVARGHDMCDIDTATEAVEVAAAHPRLRFARRWAELAPKGHRDDS